MSAQVRLGTALLSLHRATGDRRWLEVADRIGKATLKNLYDDRIGGFFATVPDATAAIIAPRKPLEANGTAASFYFDLWIYTKDDAYESIAADTIRAIADLSITHREGRITGKFAIALEQVTTVYVEFSIVGDSKHPSAQALFKAGRDVFEPRKLLHFEEPGRYPARDKPAMYICNPDFWSIPIEDPNQDAKHAVEFRSPAKNL